MQVESALLFDSALAPAGALEISAGRPERAGLGLWRTPVRVRIPLDAITLVESGSAAGGRRAELELRFAALDAEGGVADVPVVPVDLELERPPLPGAHFEVETHLRLRRDDQRLLVVLHDPLSGAVLSGRLELEE